MKTKRLICLFVAIVAISNVSILSGCGSEKYDVKKNDIAGFLWENCFREAVDNNLECYSVSHIEITPYLWFYCNLSTDMHFEQVQPLLEELKQKVLEVCADKSFEPCNTFLHNEYYIVYFEIVNKINKRPSEYSRTAGTLTIQLSEFPIVDINDQEAVYYH